MQKALGLGATIFVLLVGTGSPAQTPAKAQTFEPPGRLVDLGGRRLHINCSGRGSPAVVVENGQASFSIDWALVQREVEKVTTICTYDRAGYAWSDRGPAPGTVEQTVDDLYLLLRTINLKEPYVLVGASIGGLYVRAYQRRHPEQIAGMVLVDSTLEDDLQYTVDGKSMPGVLMTYDQMRAVWEPSFMTPPNLVSAPTTIDVPYDRLPRELHSPRVWAFKEFLVGIDSHYLWMNAESWRQEFVALRKLRLAKTSPLGNLPLTVVVRSLRTDQEREQRTTALAKLSSNGTRVVAENSEHEIELYRPDVIAKTIQGIVETVRKQGVTSKR